MADALYMTGFDPRFPESTGSPSNITFDDSGDGIGWGFQAYSADPITHVGVRYGARTGTPPTYIASLQGLNTSGLIDGTVKGGGSPASVTFTPPADTSIDGLWQWYTLANSYTPTRGEFLAVAIEYSSGTINGSNCSSFTRSITGVMGSTSPTVGFPSVQTKTGGTWAKNNLAPLFGYRTASGRYGGIAQSTYTTNIGTSGQRSAMKFNLPSGWGNTYQLSGAMCCCRVASGSMIFGLWNSAGTQLASATVDVDYFTSTFTDLSCKFLFSNSTLPTLDFGTDYYIGWESVSSSSVGLRGFVLADAADRSAFPNGTNRCFSSWNGSAWSDTTTIMPMCSLIFADITEPAGGSGGGGPLIGGRIVI